MVTMFVRHKVSDYVNWKRVYDEFASVRKEKGVKGAGVLRDPNDPDIIIIMHHFEDMKAAMGFADSEDLKLAMENAGVIGPPETWFGEDIEHTPY